MTNRKLVTIEMFSGSSGDSLYINEYRIAGSKPWGGSRSVTTWKVDREKLIHYLIQADVLDGEPVKERSSEPDGNLEPVCDKDPQGCWCIRCQLGKVCKNTAPSKRVWQGLTDEEIAIVMQRLKDETSLGFARAIEAKLRERNGCS